LEGVLFAFTLYRAILDYRRGVVTGYPNSRFLFILYRDGFYYFAAVGAVNVWNALQVSNYNSTRCSFFLKSVHLIGLPIHKYAIAPMSGMFMGVYFTWAMMTVMSSRVYLNLVLAAHGGGRDGMTTGGLSSFRGGRTNNHPEGAEGERGQIVTFGAKRQSRRVALMETFTTVGFFIPLLFFLPCLVFSRLPLTALPLFLQTVLTAEYNTQADDELDSRGGGGESAVVVVAEETLELKGEEV
jgi:hypothetical protein